MRGICGYGIYLPYYRLQRSRIREALGQGGGKGTRAVASYDEDTTSMGVEAARACMASGNCIPDSLLFASASPAYQDKSNATTIHAALDLPLTAFAADLMGSQRSGTAALKMALDGRGPALSVASDIRVGLPGGKEETGGGDGAGALLIANDDECPLIAEVLAQASSTSEFLDRWRAPGELISRVWEERFGEHVYLDHVKRAFDAALMSGGIRADQLDKVIVTGMHPRAVKNATKIIQAKPESYIDDQVLAVGNTGTAHPYILLSLALEEARRGEMIALVVLADGCDVFILKTTDHIDSFSPLTSAARQLTRGNDEVDYNLYLSWRGLLEREPPRRPDPQRPAAPASGRTEHWKFAFVGSRDRETGAIHLPPQRVSMKGGAVDNMESVRMADVPATIATFTIDRLAYSPSPPMVAAVIDFDGGGRFRCELTDVEPDTVKIGDRVQMTFRKLYTADGVHNYFWKARPLES